MNVGIIRLSKAEVAMAEFKFKGDGHLLASFPISSVFHAVLIQDDNDFVVGSMVSNSEAIASPEYFNDFGAAKAFYVWKLVDEGLPVASIDAHPKALFLAKKAVGFLEKLAG